MKTFAQFSSLCESTGGRDHLQTIRNLLNLATRPGTPAEGINAREQAERLAAKYGIDIATIEPEPAPKPVAHPQRTAPPPNPYQAVLMRSGWRRDGNPSCQSYWHPATDLRGHAIVINPNGEWSHLIYGNMRYGGKSPRDLYNHLCFHAS